MPRWEYTVSSFPTSQYGQDAKPLYDQLIAHMNDMDASGWELVSGAASDQGGHMPSSWATMFWRRSRADAAPGS
jgi:hypothetical protein